VSETSKWIHFNIKKRAQQVSTDSLVYVIIRKMNKKFCWSTKIKVPISLWDIESQRVLESEAFPTAGLINKRLDEIHGVVCAFIEEIGMDTEMPHTEIKKYLDEKLGIKGSQDELTGIYMIQDTVQLYTKIGVSKDPIYRLHKLQGGSANELKIITFSTGPSYLIYELEKKIHKIYADKRLQREWFDLSKEDIINVFKMLN